MLEEFEKLKDEREKII